MPACLLDKQLLLVNATVGQLRKHFPRRRVAVFVASDTEEGTRRARRVLGPRTVLTVGGRAVHWTRTHAAAQEAKIAADFLALAVADVLLAIGSSSFSGGAGALSGAVVRHVGGEFNLQEEGLREDELRALEAYLRETEAADAAEA